MSDVVEFFFVVNSRG